MLIDITTPPLYGVGTLPLVTIDFLPTDRSTRWRLWRASFGVFTGNGGTVYVLRCDLDDSAALEDALAAEETWGKEGLDFPTGSARPSRQCWIDNPTEDEEEDDGLYIGDDGERYDLSYAALREVNPDDLDYEASLALALAILRKGIEESDEGYLEIERDRVRVGPFEIALPPGAKRAYRTFDFDAQLHYADERGWSTLVTFLIAAGVELSWVDDQEVEGAYKRVFILADERSCSGPALTKKGE